MQEGMEKPPFRSCYFSGLSNITPALTTTTVKQQIYIQPHHPMLFSENVISHFRLGSNSRQCTEIICGFWLVRVLTTLSAHISSSVISSSTPLSWSPHLPCLLSCTPHRPFPPPHLILISSLPSLSVWFQACCVWSDLVLYDWSSNYNSLWIVFPPTTNLTTYHPQA